MTHPTTGEPLPVSAPAAGGRGRRWVLLAGVLLLLAGGAAGAWWWVRRPVPVEPPLPSDVQDAEVRRALERARQEVLERPDAGNWGHLGLTLLANLFDREADRCLAEAARLDPADPRWPYARGLIALKRAPEQALPLLRQAATASASWPKYRSAVRLQLAEALLERQELDEAEELFRAERRRDPGNARAALGLGLAALARGKRQAAVRYLQAARSSPHARKTATAQLAALAGARGDADAAAYQKEAAALADDQPWPDPLRDETMQLRVGYRRQEWEVDQLERQHRYTEAADAYLRQLKERPTARACIGAGINLARVGDYERALPLLRQGVRLDPGSPLAHYTLALALFSRAEKEWARTPGSPAAREWFREVVGHARRATELKADYARAYLFWGLALKYLGKPAAAVAPLRTGVVCRPEDFELQLALGEALLEAGQEGAATHLENARRLDPKDPRPARALERLRKPKG
jgi:Flp pilus assembly protein TadD